MGKQKALNKFNSKNKITAITSRKELRKQKRKEKKARKNYHYQKKFIVKSTESSGFAKTDVKSLKANTESIKKNFNKKRDSSKKDKNIISDVKTQSSFDLQTLNHKSELRAQNELQKEMADHRKKQFLVQNKDEDKVIRKLEKQLRLNKRKTKSLPKSFADEGLDYLLDVCDSEKIKNAMEAERILQDSGSEFEEDLAAITGKQKISKKAKKDVKNNVKESSSDSDDENNCASEDSLDDLHETSEFNDSEGDNDMFSESNSENEEPKPKKTKKGRSRSNSDDDSNIGDSYSEESEWNDDDVDNEDMIQLNDKHDADTEISEDIYGRKRDKDGNVIPVAGKYIPPHVKAQMLENSGREEIIARLKKQIKGLLNRLAESNMHSIVSQLDKLYMQNSRNDMNDTLTKLAFDSLIQPILVPERLIIDHTMLIAALHANVGTEIGAHFLQAVVEKFNSIYNFDVDIANKEVDNVLLVIAHLYCFKVFNCVLIFDILMRLVENPKFGEKEVELLLIVLRAVGFNLRKDDPVALKTVILKVQSITNNSTELCDRSRVRFMLDILAAIKNNNMTKIPNYDPKQIEHHKKFLKTLIYKGKYISELNITLNDLLKASEQGRWWVVGSAWSGKEVTKPDNVKSSVCDKESDVNNKYAELAKQQRMNTDIRKNIFFIIMSAEDYLDAFEKLLRLCLKGSQEQTIIHVIVHCVLHERTFNPYYALLAAKFCDCDRKHQMTLQFYLWDRIKELKDSQSFTLNNLALFMSHLILEKALPLSVLKVIEFASLSKPEVRLLRRIFITILMHKNKEAVAEVFQRIAKSSKLKLFKDSIRLFLHHFILRNMSEDTDSSIKIRDRVLLAEQSMNFHT